MPGAVWYATGYLHSPYTAAEHSILTLQQQGPACPCPVAAATDEQIQRLVVVLQAASHSSWFTSCLGLSGMPLATYIAHIRLRSTRFWRFGVFLPSVDRVACLRCYCHDALKTPQRPPAQGQRNQLYT